MYQLCVNLQHFAKIVFGGGSRHVTKDKINAGPQKKKKKIKNLLSIEITKWMDSFPS